MTECIFCKILTGEIPSVKIWEDNEHIAILDVNPLVEGQALVIPRRHMESYLFDIPKVEYKDLMLAAKKAGKFLDRGLRADRVLMVAEGLEVDHSHVRLYPYHKDNASFTGLGIKQGASKTTEELQKIALKIKENNK